MRRWRNLTVRRGRVFGRPAASAVVRSGTIRGAVADVYPLVALSGAETYDVPTAQNLADMAAAWDALESGDTATAIAKAGPLGYDVVDFTDTDTGRTYWLLEERQPYLQYWGWYALSRATDRSSKVIAAPHTRADLYTHTQSADAFVKANATALFVATAHRDTNAATDADGDNVTDVANCSAPPSSVFQAVAEAAAVSGALHVQHHGFGTAEPMGSAHRVGSSSVVIDPAALSGVISAPGNIAVGDRLLAQVVIRDVTATYTSPPGWTLLHETNDVLKTLVLTRVVEAADIGASYSWSWSISGKGVITMVAYESCGIVDVSSAATEPGTSPTTHSTAPITTTVANTVLVAFYAVTNATSWSSTGATVATNRVLTANTSATGSSSAAIYDTDNAVQPVGTYTATAVNSTGSSNGGFVLIALRPGGTVVATEIILSSGATPQPAHIAALAADLTAAGFNVVNNDGTWTYLAAGNVQGAAVRGVGGRFAHLEQSNLLRSDSARLAAVADVIAAFEAAAQPPGFRGQARRPSAPSRRGEFLPVPPRITAPHLAPPTVLRHGRRLTPPTRRGEFTPTPQAQQAPAQVPPRLPDRLESRRAAALFVRRGRFLVFTTPAATPVPPGLVRQSGTGAVPGTRGQFHQVPPAAVAPLPGRPAGRRRPLLVRRGRFFVLVEPSAPPTPPGPAPLVPALHRRHRSRLLPIHRGGMQQFPLVGTAPVTYAWPPRAGSVTVHRVGSAGAVTVHRVGSAGAVTMA